MFLYPQQLHILDELSITQDEFNSIKHLDNTYLQIQEKLLYFHKSNNCGIVVCPICHSKIDQYYYLEKIQGIY